MTCGKLTCTPSTSTPMSLPCSLIWETSSAECSRHFVGMQPTFRHVPPRYCFSITVTCAPSCAARIAATYPPGPPPMTITLVSPFFAGAAEADGAAGAAAVGAAPTCSPGWPIQASVPFTGISSPSCATIFSRVPSTSLVSSLVSLSVVISATTSPAFTESPSCLTHLETVPSSIVRPS